MMKKYWTIASLSLLVGVLATAVMAASLLPSQPRPYGTQLQPGTPNKLRCAIVLQAQGQWPGWGLFWSNWQWDTFVQPALNAAASVGANCVKMNGDGVTDATGAYPSGAVLQAEILQFCNYAAAKGMVVYWQLGYRPNVTFATSVAAGSASAATVAGYLNGCPNVVAIDVMNEVNDSSLGTWGTANAQFVADMTTYIAAIRAATKIPLAYSVAAVSTSDITGPWMANAASLIDFHDFHAYYYPSTSPIPWAPSASDVISLKAQTWYLGHFIVGEGGVPFGTSAQGTAVYTQADQTYWANGMANMLGDSACYGGAWWGLNDTSGAGLGAGNWGIGTINSDGSFTPRSNIVTPFMTWPGRLG